MAVNVQPIFPVAPKIGYGDTIATLTSRAKITGTTGLTQVTATSTNGLRVDAITVTLAATSSAACVLIFLYNGTTSFLFDEFVIAAVTASNTVPAYSQTKYYPNLVLGPNDQIYAATTIAQNTDVFAFGGTY